jgi:hypothetical protein
MRSRNKVVDAFVAFIYRRRSVKIGYYIEYTSLDETMKASGTGTGNIQLLRYQFTQHMLDDFFLVVKPQSNDLSSVTVRRILFACWQIE